MTVLRSSRPPPWRRIAAFALLGVLCVAAFDIVIEEEVRSYDGRYNNKDNPEWGATNTPRIRHFPPHGAHHAKNHHLPSARRVMEELFRRAKPDQDKTTSHLLLEFGHFIVQDILGSSQNLTEPMPIPCDGNLTDYVFCPVTGKAYSMSFYRQAHILHPHSATNNHKMRNTVNGMTSFLDLSNLYGLTWKAASKMRYPGGKVYLTPDTQLPSADQEMLPEGMKQGMNTSPGAFAFYVLFMRYHNYMADQYASSQPHWDDEQLFEAARKQTIAVYQSWVEEAYVPTLLGDKLPTYEGYQPNTDPSIDEFFSAVSFRYAHTNFAGTIRLLDAKMQPTAEDPLMLRDVFKQDVPTLVSDLGGIEPFLRGLVISPSKAMDASFVDDLNVWSEATSVLDVQRGRDVGIPPYNEVRQQLGLPKIQTLQELVPNDDAIALQALRNLYQDNVDLVDAYVGAIMEPPLTQLDPMGPVLTLSLRDQFTRLRDGDRFWYKNIFSQDEFEAFPTVSELIQLVCKDMELFPQDPFLLVPTNPDTSVTTEGSDACVAGEGGAVANQITFLKGDFLVRWQIDHADPNDLESETTIDVTLTVTEEMEGPGYIGIGWASRKMKGSNIWFCTVDYDLLQAEGGLAETCSAATETPNANKDVISCCLAQGEHHEIPKCAEPGDDLFYALDVLDWCLSKEQSSVTIRALTCGGNNKGSAAAGNTSTIEDCFELESTVDGKMDMIVAYNPLSLSRPHGYQRRTGAQIDLKAGVLTQMEAHTADKGLMATHGIFMLVGWVVLAPIGVFVVRYMKTKPWRLLAHISIMGFVGVMMIPLLVSTVASVGASDKMQDHSIVGLIVFCIFCLMATTGTFRYVKWQGRKIGKKVDFITKIIHRLGGVTFIALAWWNCYTGLVRISPESPNVELLVVNSYSMGYDMPAFGFIKDYIYFPWIALVVVVFLIFEFRKCRSGRANAQDGSLWDDDGAGLDPMTLDTFLDVTKLGYSLCIIEGRVLDITDFASSHPGGPELLRYVRGSDITEEFLGKRDVSGIRHQHSRSALQLVKTLVVAKLVDDEKEKTQKGRPGLLPGLMKSTFGGLQSSSLNLLPAQTAMPFRRARVVDVQYLAPSSLALHQKKPVILLRLSMQRQGDADKEDRVTKLPGCSFRFRGIDKRGIMFEREYTAVRIRERKTMFSQQRQPLSLRGMNPAPQHPAPARFFKSIKQNISEVLCDEECYDFVISLIPGGQMSSFLLGLKTGKLLLAQGPKVSPPVVANFSNSKWKTVVFLAGGTGIAPMLQVIDFYLQRKRRDSIPFMFLIWVIRSPHHSFHETLGLMHRVKASVGRLRLITIFSKLGDESSSTSSAIKNGLDGSSKSSGRGRPGWMRMSQPDRPTHMRSSELERPAWMRASQEDEPAWMRTTERVDEGRGLPGLAPLARFFGLEKKPKVRDLIARAQRWDPHDETIAEDPQELLESEFWVEPVRSLSKPLDQRLVDKLLTSAQEHARKLTMEVAAIPGKLAAHQMSSLTVASEHHDEKTSTASMSEDTEEDKKECPFQSKEDDNALDATVRTLEESCHDATARTLEESMSFEEHSVGPARGGVKDDDAPAAFDGMLVTISGSPAFESQMPLILASVGLPKNQVITFGVSTQQV